MRRLFAALVLGCACSLAAAQYPDKPIRLIVPYAAGGPTDLVARLLGEKLTERWKQPVVVENKPGASGVIGVQALTSAAPDGYTLALHATAGLTIYQATAKKPAYDTLKDLTPVAPVSYSVLVLVANRELPVDDVKGLVEYAKKNPGKLSYGSAGIGALNHVGAELFKLRSGVDLLHVPYKGDAPVVADLLNGSVAISFLSSNLAIAQLKGGKVKGLAVTSRARLEALPELPTMIESGVPDFDLKPWNGIVGPAGMPKDVVLRLNQALGETMARPEVRKRLAELGLTADAASPEAFAERIGQEIEMWRVVVKRAGIPLE